MDFLGFARIDKSSAISASEKPSACSLMRDGAAGQQFLTFVIANRLQVHAAAFRYFADS